MTIWMRCLSFSCLRSFAVSAMATVVIGLTLYPVADASSRPSFLQEKARGWHWYEEALILKRAQKPQTIQPPTDLKTDPLSRLARFQKQLETVKAQAVLDPTPGNVKAYMELQRAVLERASHFAETWMRVVYQTPELDYSLKHPTTQAARHVYLSNQQQGTEAKIRALSQTHGLFFFYSGSCGYCRAFAPIVKRFADQYGWDVLSISLDGEVLPEFPRSRRDNGAAEKLGIRTVPALLAVNPKTGNILPLSYGLSTHDQIEARVRLLTKSGGTP